MVNYNPLVAAYNNDIDSYCHYIKPKCQYFIVMDAQSRAIAFSENYAKHAGYDNPVDFLGLSAEKIKCPVSELALKFSQQDQLVLHSNVVSMHLMIANYHKKDAELYLYIKEKYGKAVVCNTWIPNKGIIQQLLRARLNLVPKERRREINIVYNITDGYGELAVRESEVLYFLMQFYSSTKIGELLHLSKRTVQHYIENIKRKLSCQSTQQVLEYCFMLGYQNEIPKSLLMVY